MSKKNDRRLSLKRETLRQLDADLLGAVAGGGTVRRSAKCGESYNCAATYTCGGPTEECVSCPCAE